MDFSLFQQIQILPFDTSCQQGKYLLRYKSRYFEVSFALAELIRVLQQHDSMEKAAASFSMASGRTYSPKELSEICIKYLRPIFDDLPSEGNQHASTAKKGPFKKNRTFIFKFGLIPPSVVKKLASHLQFLLYPQIAIVLLLAILGCEILFFTSDLGVIHSLSGANAYAIFGTLCLFVTCSFFHELGHATACRHFNVENGGIGCGLYLAFPVLYTDVTNIWQLTRRQRIVVNFSGVYFQLIFLLPFFLIYFTTKQEIAKLFIYTININFLFTLNPFFKFDGYWIMSDLIGVPNLRQRSMEYFSYLFKKLRRKPVVKPFLLTIKPCERWFMIIYSVVVNLFFAYFFIYAMPLIVYNFITNFWPNIKLIFENAALGIWPDISLVVSSLLQLVFIGFILTFLYKIFVKLFNMVRSKKSIV